LSKSRKIDRAEVDRLYRNSKNSGVDVGSRSRFFAKVKRKYKKAGGSGQFYLSDF
jgi:hypothetical protein